IVGRDLDLGEKVTPSGNWKGGELRKTKGGATFQVASFRKLETCATVNLEIERLGLKPSAVALWAGSVCAITAEQNAHVHFVGLALGPAEKSPDSVPAIVLVIIFDAVAALLAFDDKILICFR